MAARVVKDTEDVGGVFAELIASVRVPKALVIAPGIEIECPTKKQVADLLKVTTEEDAQKIIFGEHYEAAMELFDDAPVHVWNTFMERYNEHFFNEKALGKSRR